jgi:hypothetical protein
MDGSATFTIVMSTTIRRKPAQSTIRESQREFVMPPWTTGFGQTHRSQLDPALRGQTSARPMSFRVRFGLSSDGEDGDHR